MRAYLAALLSEVSALCELDGQDKLQQHMALIANAAKELSDLRVACGSPSNAQLLLQPIRNVLQSSSLGIAAAREACFEVVLNELRQSKDTDTAAATYVAFARDILTIPRLLTLLPPRVVLALQADSAVFISGLRGTADLLSSAKDDKKYSEYSLVILGNLTELNPELTVESEHVIDLVRCLSALLHFLPRASSAAPDSDDDSFVRVAENADQALEIEEVLARLRPLLEDKTVLRLMESAWPHSTCLRYGSKATEEANATQLSRICSVLLLVAQNQPEAEPRLLGTLAYAQTSRGSVLRRLWYASAIPVEEADALCAPIACVDELYAFAHGNDRFPFKERLPILELFSKAYLQYLLVLSTRDMFDSRAPFTRDEVLGMSATLRELVFRSIWPSTRPSLNTTGAAEPAAVFSGRRDARRVVVRLLARLHRCDQRHRFTGGDAFWIAGGGLLRSEAFASECVKAGRLGLLSLSDSTAGADGPQTLAQTAASMKIGASTVAAAELLLLCPFVIPFNVRASSFSAWIEEERAEANAGVFGGMGSLWVTIRRQYVFEDAIIALGSARNGALKRQVRVKFVSEHGIEEAGIDGGGVYKEFLHTFFETAFSPSLYGLFKATDQEQRLYPNPYSALLSEQHLDQFEFLGRMLGKALFDGVLVKLPFAQFFLNKLLGHHNTFEDLASLDPELYRNLLYVKDLASQQQPSVQSSEPAFDAVAELGLTFTVAENEYGEGKEIELVPGGSGITVTSSNRMQYLLRVADYRLNQQLRAQSAAFLRGFADVMRLGWVRVFDAAELQLLISGKEGRLDVDDLERHTVYSGGYSPDDSVIANFWRAVREMTPEQQAQLLRFVTSTPRAPLLGFRYLNPAFCIHRGDAEGGDNRLPSASTCMNMLKLPSYSTPEKLREKLLASITSNAGFDLS